MNYVESSGERLRWLASTRKLQETYFNVNYAELAKDPDQLADSIVWNHTALVVELSEFMNEVGWKNWSVSRGWVNRDAAIGELVDAAHFMANILNLLDVTDEEWEDRYRAKQEINRQRQRNGYDARHAKCPGCHRAYDDVGVECVDQQALTRTDYDPDGRTVEVVHSAWCAVKRQNF